MILIVHINCLEVPNHNKKILTCEIADNYLMELYASYKSSKKMFKYKIIFFDILKIFETSRDFIGEVFKQIENLFNQSTITSIEERDIISNIKSGKLIDRKDQKYLNAKDKLKKNGIIKEITANIFGVI